MNPEYWWWENKCTMCGRTRAWCACCRRTGCRCPHAYAGHTYLELHAWNGQDPRLSLDSDPRGVVGSELKWDLNWEEKVVREQAEHLMKMPVRHHKERWRCMELGKPTTFAGVAEVQHTEELPMDRICGVLC